MPKAWTDKPVNVTANPVEQICDELEGQDLIGVGSGHAKF